MFKKTKLPKKNIKLFFNKQTKILLLIDRLRTYVLNVIDASTFINFKYKKSNKTKTNNYI